MSNRRRLLREVPNPSLFSFICIPISVKHHFPSPDTTSFGLFTHFAYSFSSPFLLVPALCDGRVWRSGVRLEFGFCPKWVEVDGTQLGGLLSQTL